MNTCTIDVYHLSSLCYYLTRITVCNNIFLDLYKVNSFFLQMQFSLGSLCIASLLHWKGDIHYIWFLPSIFGTGMNHSHESYLSSYNLCYLSWQTTFKGRVFMTHATKAIYKLLLSDYVKISKVSVEDMLYDEQDILRTMDKIEVSLNSLLTLRKWGGQYEHVLI